MDTITNKIVNPTANSKKGINFKTKQLSLEGSEIAAALGISPVKTSLSLYLEKVGEREVELPDNEYVALNQLLEDPIANKYGSLTGQEMICSGTFIHPEYPFLRSNPNRIILECQKILEIKTMSDKNLSLTGKSISEEVMQTYMLQIFHSMLVTGIKAAELVIVVIPEETRKEIFYRLVNHVKNEIPLNFQDLLDNSVFCCYTFENDNEINKIIIEGASKFWEEHVKKRCPPSIDYSYPYLKEILRRKFDFISEKIINFSLENEKLQANNAQPATKKGETEHE